MKSAHFIVLLSHPKSAHVGIVMLAARTLSASARLGQATQATARMPIAIIPNNDRLTAGFLSMLNPSIPRSVNALDLLH